MKVNFAPNTINGFGKTYIDKVKVRTTGGGTADVNFVEYHPGDKNDKKQLAYLKIAWGEHQSFIKDIYNEFVFSTKIPNNKHHFYGLENATDRVLAIAEITDKNKGFSKKYTYIDYVQTAPNEQYSPARPGRYRGLGETLISKIVQRAKDENKDCVKLTSVNDDFWNSSSLFKDCDIFAKIFLTDNKRLSKDDYDKYISYVDSKKTSDNITEIYL